MIVINDRKISQTIINNYPITESTEILIISENAKDLTYFAIITEDKKAIIPFENYIEIYEISEYKKAES